MNENIVIVFRVLPVVLLIGLGVFFDKTRFVSADVVSGLKKLIMDLAFPCLLFLIFMRSEMKPSYMLIALAVFVISCAGLGMGFLFKRLQRSANPFYPSVFSSFVTGILGFSLYISVFGADQLYKLAIIDIGNLFFVFIVLANYLDKVRCGHSGSIRMPVTEQIIHVVKSPLLIGGLLGILISITGGASFFEAYPATAVLLTVVTMLSNTAVPLILLVIGYEMHFNLKSFVQPIPAVVLRLAMNLSFAYILNEFILSKLLGLGDTFKAAVYTMFVLPPAFIISVFIKGECEEKRFVLNFLSVHVIISIIIFTILMTVIN